MKFSFIAKHRGIWAVDWMCEALGVSRGGFYAWLTRPRSRRSRDNDELGAKVRASFLASDRTYGARRVWRDLLEEGSGNVWDNAAMESFFSSLKTERTGNKTYRTRDEARMDVFDYIERFYNSKRRHSTIGYLSPMEFERKAGFA